MWPKLGGTCANVTALPENIIMITFVGHESLVKCILRMVAAAPSHWILDTNLMGKSEPGIRQKKITELLEF